MYTITMNELYVKAVEHLQVHRDIPRAQVLLIKAECNLLQQKEEFEAEAALVMNLPKIL